MFRKTNHVALYRRKFVVSKRLADTKESGGSVSIVFHGMATAIYVWVNGLFAGYGEDGFTPNEFDITDLLHDGENVVAVACYEYSSASWLEDQDFWRLHGLFRSVELTAQPHVHVENMQLEADWDAESGTASLDAALSVRNASDAATISATLKDSEGQRGMGGLDQRRRQYHVRKRFLAGPRAVERRKPISVRA